MQITARKFTSLFLIPLTRKEFFEVSNVGFKNQWCSISSAAVSSYSFIPQQGRKKVKKQERVAMVLAFVEKYRALNAGKFPSASCTKKQIGGSYYVTRSIIQELEYNYKRASFETKKEIREENAKSDIYLLTEQPCISVGDDTEIRKKHSSNKSQSVSKTSQLSIKTHSDNEIEINAYKQTTSRFSKECQEDKCLGFGNLHASPLASATIKPQTKTEVNVREENGRSEILTEQPSISVVDGTEVRKHSSKKSKSVSKTSQLSMKTHSDNEIEINAYKQPTPSRISEEIPEENCLGFGNLHASPSARATQKPQTQTSAISDTEAMHVENLVSAKLKSETITLHTPTKKRKFSEKDIASATNVQDTCISGGKKISNEEVFKSEEFYHGEPKKVEEGAASANVSSFWVNLKSMAFTIVNLWKK